MELNLIKNEWNIIKLDFDDNNDEEDTSQLIKFEFKLDKFELLMFNLNKFDLFHYCLKSQTDIQEKCNLYNSSTRIEIESSELIKLLNDSFTIHKDKCKFKFNSHTNRLNMETKIDGISFYWNFDLKLLSKQAIKDYLFLPLLFNLTEKHAKETELLDIIRNKDKIIDDFKSQGVKSNLSKFFNA